MRQLSTPETAANGSSIRNFARSILHGDDEHRKWLLEAAEAFVTGEALPAPRQIIPAQGQPKPPQQPTLKQHILADEIELALSVEVCSAPAYKGDACRHYLGDAEIEMVVSALRAYAKTHTDQVCPKAHEPQLAANILQYAGDLRRNSSGGDDYPWELMRGVADELDRLVFASSVPPHDSDEVRDALEDTQGLLAALLLEKRPESEIEDQIKANRRALSAPHQSQEANAQQDALERIALLDEADGHELTREHALQAVAIATSTLGKHPSQILVERDKRAKHSNG